MGFLGKIQSQDLSGWPQEGYTAGSCLGRGRTQGFGFGVVIQRPRGALRPLRDKGRGRGTPWGEGLIGARGEGQLETQRCGGVDQGVPGKGDLGEAATAKHTAEGLWCGVGGLALSLLTAG